MAIARADISTTAASAWKVPLPFLHPRHLVTGLACTKNPGFGRWINNLRGGVQQRQIKECKRMSAFFIIFNL
jgi:hypothetical protein